MNSLNPNNNNNKENGQGSINVPLFEQLKN